MTRLLSAFLLGACLLAGCTTTRTIQRPETVDELHSLVWKKREHITLLYGAPVGGASSVPASLALAPSPAEADAGVPPVDLSNILSNLRGYEVKRRGLGALEGLGLGTLFGFLTGALLGLAIGDDGPCTNNDSHFACIQFSATDKALMLGFVGGVAGHAGGPLIGALVGHTDRYIFSNEAARP